MPRKPSNNLRPVHGDDEHSVHSTQALQALLCLTESTECSSFILYFTPMPRWVDARDDEGEPAEEEEESSSEEEDEAQGNVEAADVDAHVEQSEEQIEHEAGISGQRQKISITLGKKSLVCHVSMIETYIKINVGFESGSILQAGVAMCSWVLGVATSPCCRAGVWQEGSLRWLHRCSVSDLRPHVFDHRTVHAAQCNRRLMHTCLPQVP